MTSTGTALSQQSASTWVERLGRIGLLARGATYILIGFIALQMAFGDAARSASQSGAFRTVAAQPFGEVLLWIIAIGLVGYALWQLIAAFQANDQKESREWAERAGSTARCTRGSGPLSSRRTPRSWPGGIPDRSTGCAPSRLPTSCARWSRRNDSPCVS